MREENGHGPYNSAGRFGNGARPEGLNVRPVPFAEVEEPIDLVAVQSDDELISALSAGMSVSSPGFGGYNADDHVAAILAAWKAEVDATPIPELVDVHLAAATIVAATRPKIGRARHLAPVAAAAAVIIMAVGGLSVGSYSSKPGDALWGVSKVLYSERAKSVEAAERVETAIDSAKRALLKGDPAVASKELEKAAAEIAAVRPEEGKEVLVEVQTFLAAKADETPQGQRAELAAPLTKDPAKPVPEEAKKPPADPPPTAVDPVPPVTTPPVTAGPTSTVDPGSVGGGTSATATTTPNPTTKPTTEGGPGGTVTPTAPPAATVEGGPSSTAPSSMGSDGPGGEATTAGAPTQPS